MLAQAPELAVLGAVDDGGDVLQPHRRTVAIGDHQVEVLLGIGDLVVGVDRRGLRRPVEIALRRVDVGVAECGAQIVDIQAVGGQRPRIDLHAHRRPLAAADADQADAGLLGDLLRQPRVGDVLHLRQRQRLGGERQRQDRRIRRIDLGIDRRRRQIGGQQVAGRVDRRLHLLLRDVQADIEAELQGDHRRAGGAGREHLVQAGHLPELHFQRRGDRGGHHLRTGAGIEGLHLDGRVIDLGQGGDRQEAVGDDADQQDRGHQQRGRHGPQDEQGGGAHAVRSVRAIAPWLARVASAAERRA